MRRAILCAVAALGLAPNARAELRPFEPPVTLTFLGLERQRKDISGASSVVRTSFRLQAAQGVDLSDLNARVDYVDYKGGAIGRPGLSRIGSLKGGAASSVTVESTFVPVFNGYVFTLSGRLDGQNGQWKFYGAPGAPDPWYLPESPIPNYVQLVCMATELDQALRSRGATLYLRVKNLGAVKATGAKARLVVTGRNGRKLGEVNPVLSDSTGARKGEVNGGEERLFEMRFRSFPEYEGYSVELTWDKPQSEAMASGGEFTGARDVELAKFAFKRDASDKKRLAVSFKARNGLDRAVSRIRVTLRLVKGESNSRMTTVKTLKLTMDCTLQPGEEGDFSQTVEDIGAFDDFEYEVAYDQPSASAAPPPPVSVGQAVVAIAGAARKPDDTVVLTGTVDNSGSAPIQNVLITVSFKRKVAGAEDRVVQQVKCSVPGVVEPKSPVDFELTVKNCPQFDEYFYEVSFAPAGGAG